MARGALWRVALCQAYLLVFGLAASAEVSGQGMTDREILELFYDATDGDNWRSNTNWKTDAPLNEWYGVTATGDTVTRLDLFTRIIHEKVPGGRSACLIESGEAGCSV